MDSLVLTQSKWKTWVLAFFSLSGISVSSYYLQRDFYSLTTATRGEELGEVVACDAEAKRKHADSYLWSRLAPGQAVYLKDSIRVGPQGYANITLKNGTKIELAENSLVIIDDPRTLALKFLRGSFIVADERGERSVLVQKDGRALERDLYVRMIAPAPSAKLLSRRNQPVPVELKWAFKPEIDPKWRDSARLLIGRDRSFQSGEVVSVPVTDLKSDSWKGTLAAGRYYWKVMGGNENLSEVRDFTVLSVEPLVPTYPNRNDSISLYTGHMTVPFRWLPKEPEKGLTVFLDVSAQENFSNLLMSLQVDPRTGSAAVEGLEPGNLYWRLRSQFTDEKITSPTIPFSISQHEKVALVLRDPSEGATHEVGSEIRFAWDMVDGDFDYRWQLEGPLGAVADVVSANKTVESKSSSLVWTAEVPGNYRWRAIPFFQGVQAGDTAWRSLTIVAAQPILQLKPDAQAKLTFWNRNWSVYFTWQAQSGGEGQKYRVKIAEDIEFTRKLTVLSSEKAEYTWIPESNDDGGYRFWVVEWVGANNEIIRTSGVRRFFIGLADVLPPPIAKTPESGAEIALNEIVRDPELTWEPLEKAVSYEVSLTKDGKPWQEKTSKQTSFTLPKLKPGTYTWTVRAVDVLKRKGTLSAPRPFVVKQGAKLKAPTKTEWEIE